MINEIERLIEKWDKESTYLYNKGFSHRNNENYELADQFLDEARIYAICSDELKKILNGM